MMTTERGLQQAQRLGWLSRKQWRWALGISAALAVTGPKLALLGTPRGWHEIRQHWVRVVESLAQFNILGQVSSIGRTTNRVVAVNNRIVSLLSAMNRAENTNQQLYRDLNHSAADLAGQHAALARLTLLTAQQIPLSVWLTRTTGSIQFIMQGVDGHTAGQVTDLRQMSVMSQQVVKDLQEIATMNQTIANQYLQQAVQITNRMAGSP